MTTKSFTAVAALALAVAAVPAMALNTKGAKATSKNGNQRGQQMARYDRNGDGLISRDEFPGDAAKFDRLDTNRDGVLSQADRANRGDWDGKTKGNSNKQQMRHRGMDQNGDGVITRDEWRGNDQSFRQHDRNGDGVIAGSEMRGNGNGRKSE
jgi:Ca2+-binding EF-hand superfamily protein